LLKKTRINLAAQIAADLENTEWDLGQAILMTYGLPVRPELDGPSLIEIVASASDDQITELAEHFEIAQPSAPAPELRTVARTVDPLFVLRPISANTAFSSTRSPTHFFATESSCSSPTIRFRMTLRGKTRLRRDSIALMRGSCSTTQVCGTASGATKRWAGCLGGTSLSSGFASTVLLTGLPDDFKHQAWGT